MRTMVYTISSFGFLLGFGVVLGLGFFPPKHWKHALELYLGVETPIWDPSVMLNWHTFA